MLRSRYARLPFIILNPMTVTASPGRYAPLAKPLVLMATHSSIGIFCQRASDAGLSDPHLLRHDFNKRSDSRLESGQTLHDPDLGAHADISHQLRWAVGNACRGYDCCDGCKLALKIVDFIVDDSVGLLYGGGEVIHGCDELCTACQSARPHMRVSYQTHLSPGHCYLWTVRRARRRACRYRTWCRCEQPLRRCYRSSLSLAECCRMREK